MKLFLSRLELDVNHARAQREIHRPYELHRTLSRGFEDPCAARILFRIECDQPGRASVILQSKVAPDWDSAAGHLPHVSRTEIKTLTLAGIRASQDLRFRLLCRPSKRLRRAPSKGAQPGPRVLLKSADDLFGWLRRKGELFGFELVEASFDRAYWLDSRPAARKTDGVNRAGTPGAWQMPGGDEPLLGAVRFDGILRAMRPEKIREGVEQGIGPQKAFGFGLLSLAPIPE